MAISTSDFINRYAPYAMEQQIKYGIPASVILAQMAIESSWGTSDLARNDNNFFGIKNNTYITPKSPSILPSITNKSLQQIAKDLGYNVEVRPVEEGELATFEEAGACGTAAVISPINRIVDIENNHEYKIAKDGKPGPISTRLYQTLRNIQYGIEEDKHGWTTIIE